LNPFLVDPLLALTSALGHEEESLLASGAGAELPSSVTCGRSNVALLDIRNPMQRVMIELASAPPGCSLRQAGRQTRKADEES